MRGRTHQAKPIDLRAFFVINNLLCSTEEADKTSGWESRFHETPRPVKVQPAMYMKIITEGARRHLFLVDESPDDSKTLCGCTITQSQSWKRIRSLEGDECRECAALAFNHQHPSEDLKRLNA